MILNAVNESSFKEHVVLDMIKMFVMIEVQIQSYIILSSRYSIRYYSVQQCGIQATNLKVLIAKLLCKNFQR